MIGEKLGKYTILEIVGRGNTGTVYKAEDSSGRLVAIKLVRSQVLQSMEMRERFLRCLLIASELRHRAICPILEIGDDNDDFIIIMPFINGTTLENFIGKKPLAWTQAVDIALEAGAALEVIHQAGSAHRGVKPSNIWLLNDRDKGVMLSDCCTARFTEIEPRRRVQPSGPSADFIDARIPLDAFAYMSPEQVRGESLDHRTDVFSFGVVLYEMLSGQHPFEARHPLSKISAILKTDPPLFSTRQSRIYRRLETIIRKTLAKNRDERHQTMRELLSEICDARDGFTTGSNQSGLPGILRRWFSSKFNRESS